MDGGHNPLLTHRGLRQRPPFFDFPTTRRRENDYADWGTPDARTAEAGLNSGQLPDSVTEPDLSDSFHKFYEEFAIPADSFARAVAFAISQPDEVDINEILFRPTKQEL